MEKEYENKGFIGNLKPGITVRVGSTFYTKIRVDGDKAIVEVKKKEKK